jgi:hypothetical protein
MPTAMSSAPLVITPSQTYPSLSLRYRRNLLNVNFRDATRPPAHLPYLTELEVSGVREQAFKADLWAAWMARQPRCLKIIDGPGLLLCKPNGQLSVDPSVLNNLTTLRFTTVLPVAALFEALPHLQQLEKLSIEATDASRSPTQAAGVQLQKLNGIIAKLPNLLYYSTLSRLVAQEDEGSKKPSIAGDYCLSQEGAIFAKLETLTLIIPTITSRHYDFSQLSRWFPSLKILSFEFHADQPHADPSAWRLRLVKRLAEGLKGMSATLRGVKLREAPQRQHMSYLATAAEFDALTSCCPQLEFLDLFGTEMPSARGGRAPTGGLAAIRKLPHLKQIDLLQYARKDEEFAAVFLEAVKLHQLQMLELHLPEKQSSLPQLPAADWSFPIRAPGAPRLDVSMRCGKLNAMDCGVMRFLPPYTGLLAISDPQMTLAQVLALAQSRPLLLRPYIDARSNQALNYVAMHCDLSLLAGRKEVKCVEMNGMEMEDGEAASAASLGLGRLSDLYERACAIAATPACQEMISRCQRLLVQSTISSPAPWKSTTFLLGAYREKLFYTLDGNVARRQDRVLKEFAMPKQAPYAI